MPIDRFLAVAALSLLALAAFAADPPVRVVAWPQQPLQGQAWELNLTCDRQYANPFDPADVDLTLAVTTPSGQSLRQPAFWYQAYDRALSPEGSEKLTPTGAPGWKLRFTPREAGAYRCRLELRDQSGVWEGPWQTLKVGKGTDTFLQVAKNQRYFITGEGKPYFAVGENVCWPGKRGTYDYDDWFPPLADNGGNWARLWLNTFTPLAVERRGSGPDDPVHLGAYDLANSWRIDYVVKLAEQKGLRLLFCLDSFNSLRSKPMYPAWDNSPYNAANGGPLASPKAFFTDPVAREYFKRRLRYFVARWSASPSVMAWEFWNEVDLVDDYDSGNVATWHGEMADYLRQTDPHHHLLTTSYAGVQGDPAVQAIPQLDFIQMHHYGPLDHAAVVVAGRHSQEQYHRPALFGEIGLDWLGKDDGTDKQAIELQNAFWAGLMSGAAGTPMTWWWDNCIHPLNLYHVFAPVSKFARQIPFAQSPVPVTPVKIELRDPKVETYDSLDLARGRNSWDKDAGYQPLTLDLAPDAAPLPQSYDGILHGVRNHKAWHNPQTFRATFPRDGSFAVIVANVSPAGGARLQIRVDGQIALDKDMPCPAPEIAGQMHTYDAAYEVPLKAGPHEIVVENLGNDWVYVSYRLGNFRASAQRLRVLALQSKQGLWLWAQNTGHVWSRLKNNQPVVAIPPTRITFAGLGMGKYTGRAFDTRAGEWGTAFDLEVTRDGALTVPLPELAADVALSVVRR